MSTSPIQRKAPDISQRSPPRQLQQSNSWSPNMGDVQVDQYSPSKSPGGGGDGRYSDSGRGYNNDSNGYRRQIGLGMLLERNTSEPHVTRVKEVVRNLGADKTQQVPREAEGGNQMVAKIG
jgi:hypothetical protein